MSLENGDSLKGLIDDGIPFRLYALFFIVFFNYKRRV